MGGRDARRRRPAEWGYERALAEHSASRRRAHRRRASTRGSASATLVESGAIDATLADLRERGVVYEADGAVWLRTTDFGDDKDRVLVKSDGELHLPAARHRLPPRQVRPRAGSCSSTCGARTTTATSPSMQAGVCRRSGTRRGDFEVALTQLVKLERGGEEVRISKRTGDIVELRELLDEVGPDAVRLTYLLQSVDSRRPSTSACSCSSRWRTRSSTCRWRTPGSPASAGAPPSEGVERGPLADADLSLLTHDRELDLLRTLSAAARRARDGRAPTGPRTGSPPGCASSPAPSTASTTTAT